MLVVSDTSPISNLALADRLSLLKEIYTAVVIPQAVADELEVGGKVDPRIAAVLSYDWIVIRQALT